MQKILVQAVLFIFLLGIGVPVRAQQFELPDPGLTPESPVYFLDIWEERLRLFFARADSKRLEFYTANVSERLAEADKLAGRGISATQKALDYYRADMPFLYAAADRLGDKTQIMQALNMATDHLRALDHISERTDFEKKRFILSTKIFLINQQLTGLSLFAKRYPEDAFHVFGDALAARMDRVRVVAIDRQNNEEALREYAAYLSEVERAFREWRAESVDGSTPFVFMERAVRGHEETLLGAVYERLTPLLDTELLFAVNKVRELSGKELLQNLPPRPEVSGGAKEPVIDEETNEGGSDVFLPPPSSEACTQEAKICPDGSAVGRTGPNCEFAPCPSAPAPEPTPQPKPEPQPEPEPDSQEEDSDNAADPPPPPPPIGF